MSQDSVSPTTFEAMFVQSAHGLTSDGATITLQGVGRSTLFFADRPQRVVGHVSSKKFVSQWDEGENSFAVDPPNAVVAFLEGDEEVPEDVTVVLRDPRLHGDALTYNVEVLDGTLPPGSSVLLSLHRSNWPSAVPGIGGRCAAARATPRPTLAG